MEPIEKYKHNGCKIKIMYDEDASNPRKEHDNVGTMVCWHGRYELGDEQPSEDGDEYLRSLASEYDDKLYDFIEKLENTPTKPGLRWGTPECFAWWDATVTDRIAARVQRVLEKHLLILPLYLYDHGGITMSTGRFACPWDSGRVGFIYCTKETAMKEWGGGSKIMTKAIKEQALKYLEGEVETYDQYLTGSVYGYQVKHKGEVIDSCWGFFGELDYVKKEAESAADYYIEQLTQEEEAATAMGQS